MPTYISTVTLDDVVSPALEDYNPVTRQRHYVDRPARLHLFTPGLDSRAGIEFGNGTWHEFCKDTVDEIALHLRDVINQTEPDEELWEAFRREWENEDDFRAAFPYPEASLLGLVYAIECTALSHEGIFRQHAPSASREVAHLLRLARLDRVRVNPRQFALYQDGKPATYIQVNARRVGSEVHNLVKPESELDEFDSISTSYPPHADVSSMGLWATGNDSRKRVLDQFTAAVRLHRTFPIAGGAMYRE